MSVETGPRPEADQNESPKSMAEFEDEFATTPEAVTSPLGDHIRDAADRIASALDRRAARKQAKDAQDEAYGTYADNISTTTQRVHSEQNAQDKAYASYAGNIRAGKRLARQERVSSIIEGANERFSRAKERLAGFGRAALETTVGAAIITFEAGRSLDAAANDKFNAFRETVHGGIRRGAQESATYAANKVSSSIEAARTTANALDDKIVDRASRGAKYVDSRIANGIDAVRDAKSAAINKVNLMKEAAWERRENRRNESRKRHEAALARKYERHIRWMGTKRGIKENFSAKRESIRGSIERTKARGHVVRAAGRSALDAYLATYRTHTEQNKV